MTAIGAPAQGVVDRQPAPAPAQDGRHHFEEEHAQSEEEAPVQVGPQHEQGWHRHEPPPSAPGQDEHHQEQRQEEVAHHLGPVVEEEVDGRPRSTHNRPVHVHPAPTNRQRTATASTVTVASPADRSQKATGPMARTDSASSTS